MLANVPDACTLPTAARPLRLAEFDALFASTLRHQQRLDAQHLRMTLTGKSGLEAAVRDLTDREAACCSCFDFTITAAGEATGEGETVILDIGIPTAQTAVLDGLAGRTRPAARPSSR